MEKIYNYAIYHKNCLDGFSSLIILLKSNKIAEDSIIHGDMPSVEKPPKNIDGKDVIIMDVAYKYDVLKEIVSKAKSVVFIDHHITIKNDVEQLRKLYSDKITIIYDENESGASLTWQFLFPDSKFPVFLKYIKDNDIGVWKYKNTKPFVAALRVKYRIDESYKTLNKWGNLFDETVVKKLIKLGKKYEEHTNYLLNENLQRYSLEKFPSENIYSNDKYTKYFSKPGQYRVAVFNGGCPNASLLGNAAISKIKCDFAMIWHYNMEKKLFIISLRSDNTDVGTIATAFGGGGHKYASAFSLNAKTLNIQDLFFGESLARE